MPEVAILYDLSDTDELGVRQTAEDRGLSLGVVPFHKVAVGLGRGGFSYRTPGRDITEEIEETRVIINRGQSKSRRLYAAAVMEGLGKRVVNPLRVEEACASKVRCLLAFQAAGVPAPSTVFVPANTREESRGGPVDNTRAVADLIETRLGSGEAVVKVDAGTHGRGITLTRGRAELEEALRGVVPGILNPCGATAQEAVPKWFYDLRIVASKSRGKAFRCQPTAMARGTLRDFKTNAQRGNTVFRVNLPTRIQRQAEKAGEALARGEEAAVIALDAMPVIPVEKRRDEVALAEAFRGLEEPFGRVTEAKADPEKRKRFREYTARVEGAYAEYMESEPYLWIQALVQETLDSCEVLFHEANACPEYWEQTRIVGGVDVGSLLLDAALSLA